MLALGTTEGDTSLVGLGCRVGHIQNLHPPVVSALEEEGELVLHAPGGHVWGQLAHLDPVSVVHQGRGSEEGVGGIPNTVAATLVQS